MNRKRLSGLFFALCCVVGLALFQPMQSVEGKTVVKQASRQTITGTVFGVGGRYGGRTLPFRLIINRYSTPGEAQDLDAALRSGGQEELLRALGRLDAGRIQVGNNVGVTANAIIATPQEGGGTRIIVLYRRDIRLFELRYGTRSENYRFGYAEIFLRPNGTGEGTFIPTAQVRIRDGVWEVEDFGEFPARLLGLRSHGGVRAR